MTEHTSSGASSDPSPVAADGHTAGETFLPTRDDTPNQDEQAHAGSAEREETPAEGATALEPTGGEPRRRRRRGGARRRRRTTGPSGDPEAARGPGDEPPGGAAAGGEDESQGAQDDGPEAQAALDPDAPEAGKRRRRRRRGGRAPEAQEDAGRELASDGDSQPEPAGDSEAGSALTEPQGNGRRRRSRSRRRKGSRSEPAPIEAGEANVEDAAGEGEADEASVEAVAESRRPRRRRSRRRAAAGDGPVEVEGIPGEDDELAEEREPEEAAEVPTKGSRGRKRAAPAGERAPPARRAGPKNLILINAADREETRVAVVEGDCIVEFQMNVKRHKSLVNDIYRGRVVNLEPAIGAAFIDFGQGRNGFLHTSDVLSAYGEEDWKLDKLLTTKIDPEEWDEDSSQPDVAAELVENGAPAPAEPSEEAAADAPAEVPAEAPPARGKGRGRRERGRGSRSRSRPRLPISDLLEKGDPVVVQVTKEAIGDKGPTLTTYISIPGRYLVLMPSMARTGVSRKIEDEKERRRLKRILESLDVPPGMGVIVRTAGTGCTKADIKRDLDYLLLLWESFGQRLNLGRGPAALYEESDVAIRTIRDLFTDDTEAVIVDEETVYQRVVEFVRKLMPENVDKVKLHEGPRPLFHSHNVEQDFERIFSRRIDLPSGGSIVIDQTEALVAIDVNSGKTRSDGFDFEDIALRTNLDAVPEIARQIRLRDLGGIIVIDFIDMLKSSHRRQVERALRDALSQDRARSKVGRISQFGLLELTRQRLGPGLSKMLFQNCPRCRGSGRLRTIESRSEAILRRLGSALTLKGFTKVEVRAAPEVVEHLQTHYDQLLGGLGARHVRELVLVPAPDQVEDSVLRYLRADGREVRPGGRRKR